MSAVPCHIMEVSPRELVESAQADFEGPLTGYAAGLLEAQELVVYGVP